MRKENSQDPHEHDDVPGSALEGRMRAIAEQPTKDSTERRLNIHYKVDNDYGTRQEKRGVGSGEQKLNLRETSNRDHQDGTHMSPIKQDSRGVY